MEILYFLGKWISKVFYNKGASSQTMAQVDATDLTVQLIHFLATARVTPFPSTPLTSTLSASEQGKGAREADLRGLTFS